MENDLRMAMDTSSTQYQTPLNDDLTNELLSFWHSIFADDPDLPRDFWLGSETKHHRFVLYLTRCNTSLVGTATTITSGVLPQLAGLGEVATFPASRGQGIATRLCQQAVSDFRDSGGQALFLGTGNPAAARIYHRLGWRKLAGAEIMVNITNGESPEAFLVDFFREPNPVTIRSVDAAARIPMIPLLHTPHDWQVLDANAGMFSTRYEIQQSCMGLYRRYDAVTQDKDGQWFGAWTDDGRVVGFSTARIFDSGRCNVDAFAHARFMDCWNELVRATLLWGESRNASEFTATLSVEDEEKQRLFESLGFSSEKPADEFEFGSRHVSSIQLRRD